MFISIHSAPPKQRIILSPIGAQFAIRICIDWHISHIVCHAPHRWTKCVIKCFDVDSPLTVLISVIGMEPTPSRCAIAACDVRPFCIHIARKTCEKCNDKFPSTDNEDVDVDDNGDVVLTNRTKSTLCCGRHSAKVNHSSFTLLYSDAWSTQWQSVKQHQTESNFSLWIQVRI